MGKDRHGKNPKKGSEAVIYKIPLHPPFPKGDILSPSLAKRKGVCIVPSIKRGLIPILRDSLKRGEGRFKKIG